MKNLIKCFLLVVCFGLVADVAYAQKRSVKKRTTTKKTTPTTTTATIAAQEEKLAAAVNDSLPIPKVKPSLRPDEAVETTVLRDRTPLPYEHLRADDAVYRHKIWREIDGREKINLPFRYAADENAGNQRFISILLSAIQNDSITVFSAEDDRFTTPLTRAQVAEAVAGAPKTFAVYGPNGEVTGYETKTNDISLDSFYKFRIKEEVIFDKESSRLFWRILGIAPIKKLETNEGIQLGDVPLFWVYYPDMRAVFAKSEIYNGKNFGARMSWEELFESRMFYGRIVKSTIDNPYDEFIKDFKGMGDKPILQLLQGETIKETIFNYEQDLWEY